MIREFPLLHFSAVDGIHESTDARAESWQQLAGVVPRPLGGATRPPIYRKLWDTPDNWASLVTSHAITSASRVVLFKIVNEGQVFLHFVEYTQDGGSGIWLTESRGMFYAGVEGATSNPVSYTSTGAVITKLAQGFARGRVWRGIRHGPVTYFGNGVDANRIYQVGSGLRIVGSQEAPVPAVWDKTTALAGLPGPTTPPNEYDTLTYLTLDQAFNSEALWWVVLTYYDPGTDGYGYEGRASSFPGTYSFSAVQSGGLSSFNFSGVTFPWNSKIPLTVKVTAGGTRPWPAIRVYAANIHEGTFHLLGQVPNATAVHTFDFGLSSFLPVGQYSYQPNHYGKVLESNDGQPPACSIFEFHNNQLWMSGNEAKPDRVWVSKKGTTDELLPEGVNPSDFLTITGKAGQESNPKVTAMHSHRDNMVCHTPRSLTVVAAETGQSSFRRTIRPAVAGAMNQACVSQVLNGRTLFLGGDLNLYDVDAIIGQSIGENEVSIRASTRSEAMCYVRQHVDLEKSLQFPQFPALFTDTINGLCWLACNQGVYQPTAMPPGSPTLFCWDAVSRNMSGPFYAPTIQSGCFRELLEGKFIFAHLNGTLCVWDLGQDYMSNALPSSAAFNYGANVSDPLVRPRQATHPAAAMNLTGLTGYVGPRVEKGHVLALGTHWFEFDAPQTRKSIRYLDLTFVRNSRCHLWVEFYHDSSPTPLTRVLGERYFDTRQDLRIPVAVSGLRVRVVIYIGVGEDKPCSLRSAKLGYEIKGKVT